MYCSYICKEQSRNWDQMLTQIRKANSVSIPTPIAPNVWILTSAPTAVSTRIMLICPEEAPRFIKTQTPIHNLWLPPACSATSQHFHLPQHYENHGLTINISLNTANLNEINVSSSEFRIWQYPEDHWRVSRRYSFCLDTIFPYRLLHNGYRITYTCRIRDILLLHFLVPTCQISAPTFTISFYVIYYCGW